MDARDRGGDREPEPGPRPPGAGLVRAVKRLEQMRQFIVGQRQAGVLNLETQASPCGRGGDHHHAAVRRELHGVIEQLLDEPASERGIERQTVKRGLKLGAHSELLLFKAPADPVELAADQRVHIGGHATRAEQAGAAGPSVPVKARAAGGGLTNPARREDPATPPPPTGLPPPPPPTPPASTSNNSRCIPAAGPSATAYAAAAATTKPTPMVAANRTASARRSDRLTPLPDPGTRAGTRRPARCGAARAPRPPAVCGEDCPHGRPPRCSRGRSGDPTPFRAARCAGSLPPAGAGNARAAGIPSA